mgnify:CR=1 FL=1
MKLVLSDKLKVIDIADEMAAFEEEYYQDTIRIANIQYKQKQLEKQLENLNKMSLSQIAHLIRDDWGEKISKDAKPYLNALYAIEKITDYYYNDAGTWIVAYFLSNAGTWRGPVARAIKKELNMRLRNNKDR